MGLRVSIEEAIARGWISPRDAPPRASAPSGRGDRRLEKRLKRPKRPAAPIDPQAVLFAALVRRLGADDVRGEVVGLVPGRRYRADIYLPTSRIVVEFDGFQYHRSKQAFQKDRERQNLFVQHGYRVLRFFNRQVRSDLAAVVEQIVAAHVECASALRAS